MFLAASTLMNKLITRHPGRAIRDCLHTCLSNTKRSSDTNQFIDGRVDVLDSVAVWQDVTKLEEKKEKDTRIDETS